MGNCKHYEICGLSDDADPAQGLCILHSMKPDKDKQAFANALANHRQKEAENFAYFVFPESANFRKATFTHQGNFSQTRFLKGADFVEAKFHQGVDFTEAKFGEESLFVQVQFLGRRANFFGAEFINGVSFSGAKFGRGAIFASVKFVKGDIRFFMAEFVKGADFRSTEFNGPTLFRGTKFHDGQVLFRGAAFIDGVDFSWAEFSNGAVFEETVFQGDKIDFKYGSFKGKSLFTSQREEGEENPIPIFSEVGEVNFKRVIIDPPDALTFIEADLTKCLFEDTDLQEVHFTGVQWPKVKRRIGVYDEGFLKKRTSGPWEKVEHLYRKLKKNYEEDRDYERAGHFHYGEKEMRRRNPETSIGLKVLLTLYWLFSGYGERCIRPLVWLGVLLVISTFGYLNWGLWHLYSQWEGCRLTFRSPWDWLQAAHYGLQVMALLKPADLVPMGVAKFIYTIQSILGPILIGLLALSVRQKLKR